jgi:hypothetical protein
LSVLSDIKEEKTNLTVQKILWTQFAEYLSKTGSVWLVEEELLPKAFWLLLLFIFFKEGFV